jgi:membrane protease YdiL (CAAX protease family)
MACNKNIIGLITTFSLIISIFIINFLSLFVQLFNLSSEIINISEYILILVFYIYLIIIIWIEQNHLQEFHIDFWTIILCIISGTILHTRLGISGELNFIILLWICSGIILIEIILFYRKVPKTKIRWIKYGILLAIIVLIPIVAIESFQINYWLKQISYPKGQFISEIYKSIIFSLSWLAPLEEILFRGLLWGYLIRVGWREEKILWFQGILFWLIHFQNIFNPITFFITIPLGIILYSILVKYSKQLSTSIIAHTVMNTFLPAFIHIIWG